MSIWFCIPKRQNCRFKYEIDTVDKAHFIFGFFYAGNGRKQN